MLERFQIGPGPPVQTEGHTKSLVSRSERPAQVCLGIDFDSQSLTLNLTTALGNLKLCYV